MAGRASVDEDGEKMRKENEQKAIIAI